MPYKVTICIPAYNTAKTIGETLDSLLAQTYRDFEIIVSDNYSTDNTREEVEQYKVFGIKLVTCPQLPVNEGSALDNTRSAIQNWNSLVYLGTGEYIGIFHADDVYDGDIVLKELEFLENHPECSAVFPVCRSFNSLNGSELFLGTDTAQSVGPVDIYRQVDLVREMIWRGHFMSSSGPLIRRDSWIKAGRIDAEQFEQACDSEFWIRLSGIGPVGVINSPLVLRRIHPEMDSKNGLQLYRYRPLPIIKVLESAFNLESVKNEILEHDRINMGALKLEQDLRIALNLIVDNRFKEAKIALNRLPNLTFSLILTLWRGHQRLQLLRLLLGKCLDFVALSRFQGFMARRIVNSRFGFPEWSKK